MLSVSQPLLEAIRGLRADLELSDVLMAALEQRFAAEPGALREYVRRAWRLTYSSTIISCYGLVEQTVDSLLMAVAEAWNRIYPEHGDLPESVRQQHRDLLLTCLRDRERARTRTPPDERAVLAALALSPADRPSLVPTAFTLSTANYRLPYVGGLLNRVGIEMGGLYHGRVDDALSKSGFANYESFIDDLVQRRNDLAHSYGDDDIINRDLLATYVEIVAGYLLDVVRLANLFAIKAIHDWDIEPIGMVVKTWTGRVGIRLEIDSIAVGDRVLLLKDDWCTSHEVLGLQSEGVSSDSFTYGGDPINVAAEVDLVPSKAEGCEVYILPTNWADLTPSANKWGEPTPT